MAHSDVVFCAFCRSSRKISPRRSAGILHILTSFICAMIFTLALFQEFDPRGIFFFIVFLGIAEVFLRLRWRLNIVCKQCGFDPVLYMKQPQLAAEKVKNFLELRKTDANYMLMKPLNLPKITAIRSEQITKQIEMSQKPAGSLLSQRI